jgi:hypothetical protein
MGLISGLLTWPLAPVQGVVWVAQQIQQEAEREWYDPGPIQEQLEERDQRGAAGLISEGEAAELEEQLVQRLLAGWGDG